MKRFLAAATFTMAMAVLTVSAATSVVLTLNGGDKLTGDLTYQPGTNDLVIDGRTVSMNDVAIISFTPGDPSSTELNSLPTGTPTEHTRHMIVMRDGSIRRGKLYSFSPDGTSVIYDDEAGQRQTVPASQIARVYLNPDGARLAYASLLRGGATPDAPIGTAGVAGSTVNVAGNQPWTDTGITVNRGDRVAFHTTGEVQIAQGGNAAAGPDGAGSFGNQPRSQYPVQAMPPGGLIGRVGNSAPFPIGSNSQPITMPAAGRLYLGINDNNFGDNSGSFAVAVSR